MFTSILKPRKPPLKYTVSHRPRVTRRLHLELDENGGLVVVAPKNWSSALIRKTVAQNDRQIARFMEKAQQRQVAPLQYTNDGLHLYLGKQYALSVQALSLGKVNVSIIDDNICAGVRNESTDCVKSALQLWYRQQSMVVFEQRLKHISQQAPWAKLIDIPLSIRSMKRTWGNCSSAGHIKLNVHLVKAPLEIVDSVIAHELCHLKEMNHSKRFYALLQSLNPDWRAHRAYLRSNGFRYLLV